MADEEISLKWIGYQNNILSNVKELYKDEGFSDVTLVSDGNSFKAHKVILSANSLVFKSIFQQNSHKDPIVLLHDINTAALRTLLTFMYNGEANVTEEFLPILLKTAEALKICGLSKGSKVAQDNEEATTNTQSIKRKITGQEGKKSKVKKPNVPPSKPNKSSYVIENEDSDDETSNIVPKKELIDLSQENINDSDTDNDADIASLSDFVENQYSMWQEISETSGGTTSCNRRGNKNTSERIEIEVDEQCELQNASYVDPLSLENLNSLCSDPDSHNNCSERNLAGRRTSCTTTSSKDEQHTLENRHQATIPLSPEGSQEITPLLDILNQSFEGRHILTAHREEGLLTPNSRSKLCNLIVHHMLAQDMNTRISPKIFCQYAQEIKSIFHKENASTYYVPYVNNQKIRVGPKGKLFDCLNNRKRCYRIAGNQQKQHQQKQVKDDLKFDKESEQNIRWLKKSTEPWDLVVKKWQTTTMYRKAELNRTDKPLSEYMSQYPILQTPTGYRLLLLDFKNLYPGKENLLDENFSDLKDNILSFAEQKADREPALKELIQVQETLSDMDDVKATEVKTLIALLSMPLLFGNPGRKRRKSSWRPTKEEASEGFITHIHTPTDLQTTVQKRREKLQQYNITLQPFIIIVGKDYLNIEQYYVIINNTFYQLPTILEAVDVCFKAFHVLNCRYPIECESTWQLIQKGLYKMQTPWDKNFVSINTLLSDIGIQIE